MLQNRCLATESSFYVNNSNYYKSTKEKSRIKLKELFSSVDLNPMLKAYRLIN